MSSEDFIGFLSFPKTHDGQNSSLPTMSNEVENALTANLPMLSSPEKKMEDDILNQFLNSMITPSFTIEACSKTRGETYLIEDKRITSKKGQWIPITVNGMLAHQSVRVSLRYEDLSFQETEPVVCHHNCAIMTPNLAQINLGTSAFLVQASAKIWIPSANEDGQHPNVEFPFNDGTVHVLFRCWNSCDSHKKFQKNRILVLEVIDNSKVIHQEKFSLRVCESIKRDHGLPTASSATKKRKLSTTLLLKNEAPDATCVLEINEATNCLQDYSGGQKFMSDIVPVKREPKAFEQKSETSEAFAPKTFTVKMKSREDEELMECFLNRLEATYHCL